MDTFGELIQAVQDDLTIGSESTFIDENLVKRVINRAKYKVEGLFPWPETDDAKTFTVSQGTTQTEYWDYPQSWRPNSMNKLVVNSTDYGKPLDFTDYLYEKENNNPSGHTNKWANQWKRFFIDPSLSGGDVVKLWGKRILPKLVADGDTTIFSYSLPEVNEAIVKEAVAILKSKGEEDQSEEMISTEAKAITLRAWTRTTQETSKEEKTRPMLEVPDMFAGKARKVTPRGGF